MSLKKQLSDDLLQLRKDRNPLAAQISVLVGDIQTAESRGKELTEDQILQLIKKTIKNNEETLAALTSSGVSDSRPETIRQENTFLLKFLPRSLSLDEIRVHLKDLSLELVENEGKKLGMAMKYFKGQNLSVDANLVKEALA